MALSTSSLSLDEMRTAFSGPTPSPLDSYYRGGSYVGSYSTMNSSIPTSGTISIDNFRGARYPTTLTTVISPSNWATYTEASGSGKYVSYQYFQYMGYRQSGYDELGNAAGGGTAAFGSAPNGVSYFSAYTGSIVMRAMYIYYNQYSSDQRQVIVLSSATSYPVVNDGTLITFGFPSRNPGNFNGPQITSNVTFAGAYTTNFINAGQYCSRISGIPQFDISTYAPISNSSSNSTISYHG